MNGHAQDSANLVDTFRSSGKKPIKKIKKKTIISKKTLNKKVNLKKYNLKKLNFTNHK